MTLELIIFIASILFGALIYWRESQSNRLYRFFNKIMYSRSLQMKPADKTGFVYQQKFLVRLVFIGFLFLIAIVVARFLIPIDVATISIFASMIVGTNDAEIIEEQPKETPKNEEKSARERLKDKGLL